MVISPRQFLPLRFQSADDDAEFDRGPQGRNFTPMCRVIVENDRADVLLRLDRYCCRTGNIPAASATQIGSTGEPLRTFDDGDS
jgi:hypothetical protein